MSVADSLSTARLILVALLWPVAVSGHGRVLAVGLIVAGLTDALDGYVARRLQQASLRGARLDAVADMVVMVSAAAWLGLLHPEVVTDDAPLLIAVGLLYAVSTGASWLAFGRLVDPRQLSSKVAGGLLYLFALVTLLTGGVATALLMLAVVALAFACLETIARASHTIHTRVTASRQRSHAPQAPNGVESNASPTASVPSSSAPRTSEIRP